MNTAEFVQKRKFIVKLGKMLHKYGTPAYRQEAHLLEVASYLNLHASYITTPTSLTFVIWSDKHEDEYTHAARVQPGELDLGSLSKTDELVSLLLADKLSLEEADKQLDVIDNAPHPYNKTIIGAAFATASAAFALLMGTSWNDVFWSGLLGLTAYFWVLWAGKSKRVATMVEPASALTTGFLAVAISHSIDSGVNIWLVVLSSLIVFMPGLALFLGLAELSARHLVSGTARIMDALMMLFKLYFGAFFGVTIGVGVFGIQEFVQPQAPAKWWAWIAIMMLCASLIPIFRIRAKHILWSLLCGFIAWGITYWSAQYLDYALGTFVGAFAVGVYANLFSRLADSPATIVTMQGLIILVPGSKTYIGLNSLISGHDFIPAPHIGQQTFLIFMSMVAGLIFANVAYPSKKAL
ncbi:threonine/serine exporter family protein [Alteromonas sediminis]|uniref:Threonine/serine exporter family protein n=1 Tax=Alteromonas sediminis TaxID=2259342 RepID=A0A3N5ZAB4_9ALTE|nr:threonine/serine exporter family protein [Alteromonas sediminis]RPJ68004.1 threonine/serine exporter family protein [Alteromonas sediminis]